MKEYILLTLQLIPWTNKKGVSGETYAYSNRKPQGNANFFGNKASGFSVTRYNPNEVATVSTSDVIVTLWLSNYDETEKKMVSITKEEAELYRAEYGDTCYCDEDNNLITVEQYEELMSKGSDVDDDVTSEQPFAE